MMSNLNYWVRKQGHGIALLAIFLACVLPCRPQGMDRPQPLKILGFSPAEADIGQPVQMRISSKPSPGYLVQVNRTIVKTTIDNENPLWIKFEVPGSLPPVDSVEVALTD